MIISLANRNVKKRNWAFVLYPESAPADWREQLQKTGLPVAISPLHDRDVNATGEPKKPHYHVMVFYQGPTAYSVVERYTKSLNQPIPQPVEQVKGYYRYLTHKDNPEKAQYDEADIQTMNGFDIRDFVDMSKSEVTRNIREVQQFVMDNKILEYADLMEILIQGGESMKDWYDVASSHTMFFTAYLQSRRYRAMGKE